MTRLLAACIACLIALPALADMGPRTGWAVFATSKTYPELIDAAKTAAKTNGMGIVTQAGPTGAAKRRGITIPGNRVIGVFNNKLAVEVLGLSTAAMIEAPLRLYITENTDGTATLSYKMPSFVFEPYVSEAGPRLAEIGAELDAVFASIANDATH